MGLSAKQFHKPNISLVTRTFDKPDIAKITKPKARSINAGIAFNWKFCTVLITTFILMVLTGYTYPKLRNLEKNVAEVNDETTKLKQRFESVFSAIKGLSEISKSQSKILDKQFDGSSSEGTSSQGAQNDLQIVKVTVPKANLRLGPGKGHGVLMALSAGVRLVVEHSKNDWYRIIAPSGERAWIAKSVVSEELMKW